VRALAGVAALQRAQSRQTPYRFSRIDFPRNHFVRDLDHAQAAPKL